jgi:GTP diphosphokinase / guanosine-3',5'-bis(diphosphate) 3'-diphosphatase
MIAFTQRKKLEDIMSIIWTIIIGFVAGAIEDCEVPRQLIAETFGNDVALLVEEVTDDKSLPKAERKAKQVKAASRKSSRAKILKLADKTSNLRAVTASPPGKLVGQAQEGYVDWAREVAKVSQQGL